MPAHCLDNSGPSPVPRFAVVGEYADDGPFVRHVALLRDGAELRFGDQAEVWQTCPPIVAGSRTSGATQHQHDRCRVHVIGYIDGLTPNEIAGIETILAEIDVQTPQWQSSSSFFRHYIVHPPVEWIVDQQTGTRRYRKFSCVGFVMACYEEGAGVSLLDLAHTDFPRIELHVLNAAFDGNLDDERLRERLGIVGRPPWPIALGGYVLHALTRSASDVRRSRYLPNGPEQANFP